MRYPSYRIQEMKNRKTKGKTIISINNLTISRFLPFTSGGWFIAGIQKMSAMKYRKIIQNLQAFLKHTKRHRTIGWQSNTTSQLQQYRFL